MTAGERIEPFIAWPPPVGEVVDKRPLATDWQAPVLTSYAFLLLLALTLPTLKVDIGVTMRIGQILLMAGFGWLFLGDMLRRQVEWGPLLCLGGIGLLFAGLSLLSPYPQVKQLNFVIKYLILFPAAFYVGLRLIASIPPQRLVMVFEWILFIACLGGLLVHWFPIPTLVHERPAGLANGMKGTFWEQGEMAFFIGLFLIGSAGLRLCYRLRPRFPGALGLCYGLLGLCAVATYNKTIWLALGGAVLAAVCLYKSSSQRDPVSSRWLTRLMVLMALSGVALGIFNMSLPEASRLVSWEMLEVKWQQERGAALRTTIALIMETPWLGRGFGFVEAYFGSRDSDIIGLGSGVAQIFNAYLDLCLSMGLLGLGYGLGLLWVCIRREHIFTLLVVSFLFIFANFNPVAQHEYYHLFLGMCFWLAHAPTRKRYGGGRSERGDGYACSIR